MKVEPYLFLQGRCEEAIDFYKTTLGAQVKALMRFKEAPPPAEGQKSPNPEFGEKIMHADLTIGDSHLLLSDGMVSQPAEFAGFSLTLTPPDDATSERLFAALAEGGQVRQAMTQTFFASRFGMCADKFGVGWIVLTAAS